MRNRIEIITQFKAVKDRMDNCKQVVKSLEEEIRSCRKELGELSFEWSESLGEAEKEILNNNY